MRIGLLLASVAGVSLMASAALAQQSIGPIDQSRGTFEDKFRQFEGEDWPTPTDYRNASGAPGFRCWQQQVDYDIDVSLDEARRTLTGREAVTYTNHSPDALGYLWLLLDQQNYRRDSLAERSRTYTASDTVSVNEVLLTAALIAGLATPAMVHKGHAGLTVVEIDAVSGVVSVTHRFAAHDVEPALVSIAPEAQPSLDDPRAVADLEAHLGQRFRLSLDGSAVPVMHTDTRLAGDNVRVDFSGQTDDREISRVTVDLDFFPGVHDDQEQQVNVRLNGVTRTVIFRPGSQAQTLSFPAS